MMKLLIFFCILLFALNLKALELTVFVKSWQDQIPESYNVHTDNYIYLDSENDTLLSDVLQTQSSFNAVRSGPKGSQTSLFTRGTNSNHTLVTINGSPITDHSTSNGLSDLGAIDTSFANRLHLIDGPMSTLYGANAVGGVVDIQTEKNISNKILTTYGTYGEKKISILNNFGERKNFNIGIYLDKTDGISIYPEGDEKDKYELRSFSFDITEKYNETLFDFLLISSKQNTDLDASGSDDLDYTGETSFNFLQFTSETPFRNGKLFILSDLNNWDRKYINGSEIDNYYSSTYHINTAYIYSNNLINNVFGYDHLFYKTDFDNRGSYNSSVDKQASHQGIFNNIDVKLNKNINLSAGYRIDENSHFGNQSTYRAGLAYKINKINFFNSFATGYKNPTLYEMYGADNFGYKGNSKLKPETSFNSEIGLSYNYNSIDTKISLFDTRIKDMIKYQSSSYVNDTGGSSLMKGLNYNLNFNFDKFRIKNSYAHVHAVDSSKVWLKRRPHDILNSSIIYYQDQLSIGLDMSYYGTHSDTHSTNFSTIQIKERTIFGLDINFKNFNLIINNLLNDTYQRPHGYNQGGINMKLNYSLKY